MLGQTSIKEILFYVSSHFHFMIQNFKSQVAFTHQVFARKCQHIFVAISSVKAHCQPTSNRWDSVCFRNMECIFCVIFYIDDNRENQIQLMTKLFFFYRFAHFFLSHFEFRFISIFYTHARWLQANGHHLISRDGFVCFPISFKIWVEKQNISFISVPTQWFVRK